MPFLVGQVKDVKALTRRNRRRPILKDYALAKDQLDTARTDRHALRVVCVPLADPKIELAKRWARLTRIDGDIVLLYEVDKLSFSLDSRKISLATERIGRDAAKRNTLLQSLVNFVLALFRAYARARARPNTGLGDAAKTF